MGIGDSFKKLFSPKDKTRLKCHVCNKTLSNEDELDKHMKTVHKGYYGKLE